MSALKWIIVIWITLNALIQLIRGVVGTTRTYTMSDGVLGCIESVLAIWLVTTL